jgi:hypothetical protein
MLEEGFVHLLAPDREFNIGSFEFHNVLFVNAAVRASAPHRWSSCFWCGVNCGSVAISMKAVAAHDCGRRAPRKKHSVFQRLGPRGRELLPGHRRNVSRSPTGTHQLAVGATLCSVQTDLERSHAELGAVLENRERTVRGPRFARVLRGRERG